MRSWLVRPFLACIFEVVWHSKLAQVLFIVVVWADHCHLFPSNVNFHIFALQRFVLICEVVLNPLVLQVHFVEFRHLPKNSLVPDHNGVSLTFVVLEFTNDRQEDDVCVPVEQP